MTSITDPSHRVSFRGRRGRRRYAGIDDEGDRERANECRDDRDQSRVTIDREPIGGLSGESREFLLPCADGTVAPGESPAGNLIEDSD